MFLFHLLFNPFIHQHQPCIEFYSLLFYIVFITLFYVRSFNGMFFSTSNIPFISITLPSPLALFIMLLSPNLLLLLRNSILHIHIHICVLHHIHTVSYIFCSFSFLHHYYYHTSSIIDTINIVTMEIRLTFTFILTATLTNESGTKGRKKVIILIHLQFCHGSTSHGCTTCRTSACFCCSCFGLGLLPDLQLTLHKCLIALTGQWCCTAQIMV
mmetsp:Transcript_23260/g.34036  ORF Transcript_23260/g.34036 Transcript_23260/m.34036 type:complete len:213 (+) Transcript_23260:106-744(+)